MLHIVPHVSKAIEQLSPKRIKSLFSITIFDLNGKRNCNKEGADVMCICTDWLSISMLPFQFLRFSFFSVSKFLVLFTIHNSEARRAVYMEIIVSNMETDKISLIWRLTRFLQIYHQVCTTASMANMFPLQNRVIISN